ncbi:MAG: TolC family protein, partial [Saprospiraceae bacterium]|nr:TolC family protein [Saprospiraceae bacterium]
MRYNTIKKPIWYLMMTVLSVQGLFAQSSLSLSNCLDQVRSTSAAKQQIVLSEQTSGIQKQITSRNFYPQASLGAKATWQSTVTSLPIDIPGLMVPSVPKDQYAATLDVTQMIYDGGMTKALHNIQDMQSQLKIHQLETDVLNSETQAIDLFFQIALQQNLIINAQLLEEQLEASLNQAEKLLNGGVVDRRDVASIRIKLLETTQKIQESKYYASAAKRSLASLMQTQDTAFAIVLPDRAEVARNSFENRPEIHLLESRSDLLLAQNDLNDAQVRPSLATFINAGYGRPGLNFLANSFDWYALGGIKLSIPIDHVYTRKREMQNQINQLEIRSAELS